MHQEGGNGLLSRDVVDFSLEEATGLAKEPVRSEIATTPPLQWQSRLQWYHLSDLPGAGPVA